jgi:hypothetical protein
MPEWAQNLISGISFVIIGFLLSEIASYIKKNREENADNKAKRTMLKIEVDRNLFTINDILIKIKEVTDKTEINNENRATKGSVFSRYSDEIWKEDIYISQLNSLPKSFSNFEVNQIMDLYEMGRKICGFQKLFSTTHRDSVGYDKLNQKKPLGNTGYFIADLTNDPYSEYNSLLDMYWESCENLLIKISSIKNPIK